MIELATDTYLDTLLTKKRILKNEKKDSIFDLGLVSNCH